MASYKDTWVSSKIHDNDWALTFHHPLSQIGLKMLATLIGAF